MRWDLCGCLTGTSHFNQGGFKSLTNSINWNPLIPIYTFKCSELWADIFSKERHSPCKRVHCLFFFVMATNSMWMCNDIDIRLDKTGRLKLWDCVILPALLSARADNPDCNNTGHSSVIIQGGSSFSLNVYTYYQTVRCRIPEHRRTSARAETGEGASRMPWAPKAEGCKTWRYMKCVSVNASAIPCLK